VVVVEGALVVYFLKVICFDDAVNFLVEIGVVAFVVVSLAVGTSSGFGAAEA